VESRFLSRKLLDLFLAPANVGTANPCHATGQAANPACNDVTVITLAIKNGRIAQARFQTQGCAVAVAGACATTLLSEGRTLDEARRITTADVVLSLDGVPDAKLACASTGPLALAKALRSLGPDGGTP